MSTTSLATKATERLDALASSYVSGTLDRHGWAQMTSNARVIARCTERTINEVMTDSIRAAQIRRDT